MNFQIYFPLFSLWGLKVSLGDLPSAFVSLYIQIRDSLDYFSCFRRFILELMFNLKESSSTFFSENYRFTAKFNDNQGNVLNQTKGICSLFRFSKKGKPSES